MENKKNFYDLSFDDLKNFLIEKVGINNSKVKMRAQQIFSAVYKKGLINFSDLTTVTIDLRENLDKVLTLDLPKIIKTEIADDKTIKWLLELNDENKNLIEVVLIPSKSHNTICVSVQVGCAMSKSNACIHCATGTQLLVKNLSASEIIMQVMIAKRYLNDFGDQRLIKNCVIMGSGESLTNYENVKEFIKILMNPEGIHMGKKSITLSTIGIPEKIKKFADEVGVYLALSLHSGDNTKRDKIIPINKKYPLKEVIDSCKYYTSVVKEKVFVEYTLMSGINDSVEDAQQLIKIMSQFPSKLNLIFMNTWPGCNIKPVSEENTNKFAQIVKKAGFIVTVRRSGGASEKSLSGCGQLRTSSLPKKRSHI
ncbi:23S rRNA (adenine(2503)-C(2))-methyltransferase RlmN [Pelagibacteraceae bacterium]|jgi:23S rRNA (adenine2503-C2)-methyltransferase|nr:23S rRNA (adenine(2503)-C(2))-methyltransferase RlmN [Pelagibacteraceae bacterium]|tara:strand:- start:1362 stop:2462 length:1101 start_codon:yes stop_codon:yes gene_type:complete